MKFAVIDTPFAWLHGILAEISSRVLDEWGVAAALMLSLAGIGLRFYTPHRQMATEELVKDGKLTPDEARRQMRFLERASVVVPVLGVAILGWVLFDLAG